MSSVKQVTSRRRALEGQVGALHRGGKRGEDYNSFEQIGQAGGKLKGGMAIARKVLSTTKVGGRKRGK